MAGPLRAGPAGRHRRRVRQRAGRCSPRPWPATPTATSSATSTGAITLRELDELTDAFAAGAARRRVRAGDRVAVYLQNVPQFVIAMVGTWKAGGIVVSINPMNRERELALAADRLGRDGAGLPARPCTATSPRRWCRDTAVAHRAHDLRAGVPDPRRRADLRRRRARSRRDGTQDLVELIGALPRAGAAAGRARPGRHRVPDLHLGHHRPAQGRDEHPPQRRVQRPGLPRLDRRWPATTWSSGSRRCSTSPG